MNTTNTANVKLSKNGKRIGRPSLYSEPKALAICERVAQAQSLRTICKDDDMPEVVTILSWLDKHEAFARQYARAKERAMELMAEEIIAISDAADVNTYNPARLQVDTRKWLMSKLAPKKYGERTNVQLTDGEGGPVQFAVRSILDEASALPEQRSTRLLEAQEPLEHSIEQQSHEEK